MGDHLVVVVPWLAQGVSVAALLLRPGAPGRPAAVALGVLALVTVVTTVAAAVPAHDRLEATGAARDVTVLLRANLVRTVAWSASTVLAAVVLSAGS